MPPLATRAPAKINLNLHVLGRRADGYHELESLVAFAGVGDSLALEPAPAFALAISGPRADLAGPAGENLVARAAHALAERVEGLRWGRFHLLKRLPVAAGIGGGSSDAAAALRLLARLNGLDLNDPALVAAARATGADVPVCLAPRAQLMRGVGERLEAAPIPRLFAVLVNPGVPVPTPAVFKALGLRPGEALDRPSHPALGTGEGDLIARLAQARNDLETPAIAVAPAIQSALEALRAHPTCRLARMSGSGATVFGLFDDCAAAAAAAKVVQRANPAWWVKATSLR